MRGDSGYTRGYGESGRRGGHVDAVERFARPAETPELKQSVVSGMKAGAVGGVVMAVVLGRSYAAQAGEPLLPARVALFGVTGSSALSEGTVGAILGAVLVLIYAVAVGALFGLIAAKLVGKMWAPTAAGVGAVYGLLVWIVGQYVVLAYIAPNVVMLYDQVALAQAHVVYGVCVGVFGSAYCVVSRARR